MKPNRRFLPVSSLASAITICIATAALLPGPAAHAAAITWGAATNISADTDVISPGSLAYAYTLSNTTTTINGVPFTGSNSTTALGTNVSISGVTGANNPTAFGSGAAGTSYGNLSAAYQNLVKGGDYTSAATAITVTLNNLTVGKTYAVQTWVNDSRAGATATRTANVTSAGGNTVSLAYYVGGTSSSVAGGTGQYAIGTFTANATTQAFTITGNASSQFQSLQVRDITGVTGVSGTWNTTTTGLNWSTAANWLGSSIADGAGYHANFNTVNIAADTTVHLDSARTIGSITFGDTTISSAGSWILDNNGTPANILTLGGSAPSINVNALGTGKLATVSANIAGTSGLVKSGAGFLSLSGTNTYTGTNTISGGTLRIGSDAALGDSSNGITFSGASTLQLGATIASSTRNMAINAAVSIDTNGFNLAHSGTISGTGVLTKVGTGTLTLSGTNTNSGGVAVNAGTLVLASPSALGALPINSGFSSINAGGNTVEFATDVSVNAYNLNVGSNVSSTYRINRATSGAGVTHTVGALLGGTAATINFTSGANNTSTPTVVSPAVILSSGLGNSGQYTINPTGVNVQITGPIGNTINSTNVDKGITLSGTSTGNLVSGVISNGSNAGTNGKLPLVKSGTGTWTLTGVNTYTGITNVNAGTLAIGTGGSIATSPVVSVATGATLDITAAGLTLASTQTLIGTGTVSGTLTAASGSKIAPGNTPTTATGNAITGAVGTLTSTSLSLASGSTLDFEFGATTNDQINVTAADGFVINGGAINLYQTGTTTAFTTPGTYNLFQYTGSLGGAGLAGLSVANAQVGTSYSFGVSGGFVTLTISAAPTPAYWGVDADGSWATAGNWTPAAVPNGTSAIVNFGGSGGPGFTSDHVVTLDGGKTLGSIVFDSANAFTINPGSGGSIAFDNGAGAGSILNSNGNHIIGVPVALSSAGANFTLASNTILTLSGAVSGTGSIVTTGSGWLTLAADSPAFSGNISVGSGGTLNVGNGGSAGSLGSGAVVNNGGIYFERSDSALNSANNISGTGALTTLGTGTITLSGTNTYTGTTNVNNGTLAVSGGAAIPDAGSVNVASTATFKLNSNESIGTLNLPAGSSLELQANTLTIGGATSTFLDGTISGTGGTLAKSGASALTISGANNYTGGTSISGGIVTAASASALGSGTVSLNSGSTRLVVTDGLTLTNNITLNGGGASSRGLVENSGTGNATLSGTITVNGLTAAGGHFASAAGGTLSLTGPINSSVTVTSRIGTVIVSGGGSYTTFGVGEGTLMLGATNGLCTTATLDVGNVFSGGSGNFDLAGFNQSLSGITHSGTVGGCSIGNSSTSSNSTLTVTGTSSCSAIIKDVLGTGTQKVVLVVDGGNLTLSGANTFTGGATLLNNATVTVSGAGGLSTGTVTFNAGNTVNVSAAAAHSFKPVGNGTLNFSNLGTGTASTTLNADNTLFTGAINIGVGATAGAGKVQLNSPTGTGSTIAVNANATLYVAAAITHAAPITLGGGDTGEGLGQLRLESGALWSGPVTLAGSVSGTGDNTIGGNSAGAISGDISETGGSQTLSKGGTGAFTLSGNNSYTGATTITGGALIANSNTALGTSAGGVTMASGNSLRLGNGVTITGESVTIAGNGGNARGALQSDAGATATWAGPVSISATADSRIGAQANSTLTVSGNISGGGGNNLLVSADVTGGKVILSGTGNSYTGETQIIRGLLQLGATNTLPATTVLNIHSAASVADAASVDLNGYNQEVTGLLRGNNSGAASLTNASATASTLTINNTANYTFDSPITGKINLTKSGSGTQTLTGISTYSGNTVVNAGTLALADNARFQFTIGATSGTNNSLTGSGTVTLDGDFAIDVSAASALSTGTWVLENATSLTGAYGATFTVVDPDGTPWTDAGSDKWTKTVGTKTWTFTETTGTLTVSESGYGSWATAHAGGGAPGADFDGDGVSNALEWVLGGLETTGDLGKLPGASVSGGNLIFTFVRDQQSINADTTVEIEVGTTLAAWSETYSVPGTAGTSGSPGTVTVTKDSPATGKDTVTLSVAQAPDAKKFARLKVTINTP